MPIVAAACWLARQCPPYTLVKPRSSSGERQSRWCAVQGGFPTWAQTAWAPTPALLHRIEGYQNKYFVQQDIEYIIHRLKGRASGAQTPTGTGASRQQRRKGSAKWTAAGVVLSSLEPKEFSEDVLNEFSLDTDIKGEPILLRKVARTSDVDGTSHRHVPVIPIDRLEETIRVHQSQAIGYGGINKLFNHVRGRRGLGSARCQLGAATWACGTDHWLPLPCLSSAAALQRDHQAL